MKTKSILSRVALAGGAAALLLSGRSAHAQTTLYFDVNGAANTGFGDLTTNPATNTNVQSGQGDHYNFNSSTNWNTDSTGGAGGSIVGFSSGSIGIFDLSGTTGSPYAIRINNANTSVGGLSLLNAGSKTLVLDRAAVAAFKLNFSGGTINVGDAGSTLQTNSSYGVGQVGFFGDFTKTGAGTLSTAQTTTVGGGAGSYSGTATISGGTFAITGATSTGSSSNIVLNGGNFKVNNTGANTIGSLSGSGAGAVTAGSGSGSLLVANTLAPGTIGTAGTLNVALGAKTLNISTIAAGGLQFDLGSPGSSDEVLFSSGGLNIGSGTVDLTSFTFGATATPGTYTLFDASAGLGVLGSFGPNVTGTVDGLPAVLSTDGSVINLTLSGATPEPSTYVLLLVGGLMLGSVVRRRNA